MATIDEKEQNLFNATETLGQFYEETESFLDILYSNMERMGYTAKAERLRSGTFTIRNLPRRLLATATVIYVKGIGESDDEIDDDEPDEDEDSAATEKAGKAEVSITKGLQIPFVHLALFPPKSIPSARTLTSPTLHIGAIGEMSFIEKKSGNPATPESPALSMSSLANIRMGSARRQGDRVTIPCWRPSRMKKYKMAGKLTGFESVKLLEIDSQEKISAIAEKLTAFTTS